METFFASRGIPLKNLRQACPLCPFLVYLLENILLLFTVTELRRLRLWYIKHLASVQAPFHLRLTMQGKVHDVKFQGGCSGNTQGVARLVEGMDAKEAISRMEGIRCGFKPTSCPDQLAKALKEALN